MSEASKAERVLPTLDRLNAQVPSNLDSKAVLTAWFGLFAKATQSADTSAISNLFLEDALWRDMLALTWEFRTFDGTKKIIQFLKDTHPIAKPSNFTLRTNSIELKRPYPDIAWIEAIFDFDITVGKGSGVVHLVPTNSSGTIWKAYLLYTNLEELKGFPERTGELRDSVPNHGKWPAKRQREIEFLDVEPAVVIIGAGQSGLETAARLKLLDVPALVVDRQARIGDQWRGRYEALCLHDPVWYDHMPYIPFPASWPVWTPAPKLADWLESYAHSMELNVWMSSTIEKISALDGGKKGFTVTIKRGDGSTRTFKPRHIVFALGFGSGRANMPSLPGMDKFEGKIIHSTQFKTARDHIGKKVVIVGACTSAHDIAHDHYTHGVDVTIYQRDSTYIMTTKEGMPRMMKGFFWEGDPPTDIADRLFASFPNKVLRLLHQRATREIAEADSELLTGLQKRGFRIHFGKDGSGLLMMAYERGGGYYLDVGASKLIAEGKIGLKNDSKIARFSKNGIAFENGSELPADVVIFATGFGDSKQVIRDFLGDELTSKISDIWGLNEEGEINGTWRQCGVPGVYFMMGNLALCRFHSKHLALQIKAQEEGLYGEPYLK